MNNLFDLIWANKFKFLGIFFLVFTISYLFLVAVDFLPEAPEAEVEEPASELAGTIIDSGDEIVDDEGESIESGVAEVSALETDFVESKALVAPAVTSNREVLAYNEPVDAGVRSLPIAITIPKLGKNITVLNPVSRNIVDLDNALLDGVVRHPDSASLNQEGNVFILGHSSYLPNVFNKNFQAFNGIQGLAWGDKIEVFSGDQIFEYRVEKVYKANAQDATVPIAGAGYKLTLATCNSFGSVDDRWIVEAKRVSVKTI